MGYSVLYSRNVPRYSFPRLVSLPWTSIQTSCLYLCTPYPGFRRNDVLHAMSVTSWPIRRPASFSILSPYCMESISRQSDSGCLSYRHSRLSPPNRLVTPIHAAKPLSTNNRRWICNTENRGVRCNSIIQDPVIMDGIVYRFSQGGKRRKKRRL